MLKKDSKVLINNRGKKELGTVTKCWRRQDTWFFNVLTERRVELEKLTINPAMPCHINFELSEKLNSNTLRDRNET